MAVHTFYRIVQSDPPVLADFLSEAAQGRPPRGDDPELLRVHDGISVWTTETQARNRARTYPWIGRFIARLELPEQPDVRWERTFSTRGHYTVWGPPETLLARVVNVQPV